MLGEGDDGGDDVDRDRVEVERVKEGLQGAIHVNTLFRLLLSCTHLGIGVDLEAGGRGVERGDLRDVVVLALTLLLLQLERDTTDGPALDALHQMGGEARDLVAQALRGDDSLWASGSARAFWRST